MKKEYIVIGELQDFATHNVWLGTDRETGSECVVSVNGCRSRYGWTNLHVKVRKEDLMEYIGGGFTLLELIRRGLPESLVVQTVNSIGGGVKEERPVQWPKWLDGRFDWKFDSMRCVDRKEIGCFLNLDF